MSQVQKISQFKSNVIDKSSLARSNIFEVSLDYPAAVGTASKDLNGPKIDLTKTKEATKFLVRAAQLPASNIGVVEVPFRGRMLKIAGDRTYEPWTITVMNDEGMKIRSAMEVWIGLMQRNNENFSQLGSNGTSDNTYADMKVEHLSRMPDNTGATSGGTTKTLRTYKFKHCYPTSISSIELDSGSNDAIQEFTVEFQVAYWEAS